MKYKSFLAALVLSLALTAQAWAIPYSYEFTTGGLTGGTWTTTDPTVLGPPNFGLVVATSWHIVAPDGFVWDSSNPAQGIHDTGNYGDGFHFDFGGAQFDTPGYATRALTTTIDGPTNTAPTQASGQYIWRSYVDGLVTQGVGSWQFVPDVKSVPIPGTLWLLSSGLFLLAVWRARRRV